MKKVNLQQLDLSVNDLLTREQMKNVMGGSDDGGSGTCTVKSICYDKNHVETGSVECTSAQNICERGTTWVSCDARRTDC